MGIIATTPATEAHPTYGSTPLEILEAVQNGTYEAQPGLQDYLDYRASKGETVAAAKTGPAAPANAPAPSGVTPPTP